MLRARVNVGIPDPYDDLEKIAPYGVNAQFKVMIELKNSQKQPADLKRVAQILKSA